jgi:hypothetical protein
MYQIMAWKSYKNEVCVQNLHLLLELRVELREEEQLGPPLLPVRAIRELHPRFIIHQAQLLRPSHIHEFQVLPSDGR